MTRHNTINKLEQQNATPVSGSSNVKMGTYQNHVNGEDPGC